MKALSLAILIALGSSLFAGCAGQGGSIPAPIAAPQRDTAPTEAIGVAQ